MTRYNNTLDVWTPESDLIGMRSLSALFGESGAADLQSFLSVSRVRQGVSYATIQTGASDDFKDALAAFQAGQLQLQRPAWDTSNAVDMQAAGTVLATALILTNWQPEYDDNGTIVNAPSYAGQTVIALNSDRAGIESALGFTNV